MSSSNVRLGESWWSSKTRLPELPTGWQSLRYSAIGNGELAVIATDVDLAGERARIFAMQERQDPPSRLSELTRAGTALLLTLDGLGWREEMRVPLEMLHPRVDRFTDGRWLIVGSRTDGTPNARLVAPDGSLLSRFMLGDGIEHVGIDSMDRIWVGWFDEGIGGSGNEGWRLPGEERPPSDRGIGCFDETGKLVPLPPIPAAGWISDCYALAPVSEGAWACPYTDFPLLHFSPGRSVRWWTSDLAGPKALAVAASHALVAGGYGEQANQLVLVSLEGAGEGEAAKQLIRWSLPLRRWPGPLNEWAPVWDHPHLLTGRGDTLHLVDDGVWYCWSVTEAVSQVNS